MEGLDLRTVLDHLGIAHAPEVGQNVYACPRCGHRAMKVREEKMFFCHHCHKGGGPLGLAALAWKVTKDEAAKRLSEELGLALVGDACAADALLKKVDRVEKALDAGEAEGAVLDVGERIIRLVGIETAAIITLGGSAEVLDRLYESTKETIRDRVADSRISAADLAKEGGWLVAHLRAIKKRFGGKDPEPAPRMQASPSLIEAGKKAYLRMDKDVKKRFDTAVMILGSLEPGPYRLIEAAKVAAVTGIDVRVILMRGAGDAAMRRLEAAKKEER